MTQTDDAMLGRLVAERDIARILHLYSRAIDRCDLLLLQSLFWDDAVLDYGSGKIAASEWSVGVIGRISAMEATMHAISNILIEVEEEAARAETYCQAYHLFERDGEMRRMIVGGRYLDRFERRGGEWRIAGRTYVMDWNENDLSTRMIGTGPYERLRNKGCRFPDDPLYALLAASAS